MLLHVVHETRYRYMPPVENAHHVVHLKPPSTNGQTLLKHAAITQPAADPRSPRIVTTGLGAWSDVWGTLPAAYLLRPLSASSTATQ